MKKTEKVHGIFEDISREYDIMNDIISFGMHRAWKQRLIGEITRFKPKRILDVCCGTGDITLLAGRMNPQADVIGLDFSEKMLDAARKKKYRTELKHCKRVSFVRGDAMDLPFEDEVFDVAVISFGLRNVPDYEQVIREMARVVRPGGRVYCLDSSYPESSFVRPMFRLYFRWIMPMLGRFLAGKPDAYRWLNDSTEVFLTKKELLQLFRRCGLKKTGWYRHFLGTAACHRGTKRV